GQSFCSAQGALVGNGTNNCGFCGDLDFFRRTTGPTPTSGFITLKCENALCSQAIGILNSLIDMGNPAPASQQTLTAAQVARPLLADGSVVSSTCTVGCGDATPPCGPIVSDCFIRALCTGSFVCTVVDACTGANSTAMYATQCDNCELERRLIARTLAFDLE